AGQVGRFRRTQETEAVGQDFQDPVAEDLFALLGPPLHDGKHQFLFAQPIGVFDLETGGHFEQLRNVQRFELVQVHGKEGKGKKVEVVGWSANPGPGSRAESKRMGWEDQRASSRKAWSWVRDRAPTLVAATLPSLNSIRVGMPRMPYLAALSGFSSTFSLAMVRRPWYWAAASSSRGATILQGPHHSAQ